jgi:prolycopene isomerase
MLPADEKLRDYVDRMDRYTPSLSTFQVFLGLKRDLVSQLSSDAEVFLFPGYDTDEMYQAAVAGDVTRCAAGVMIYDTLYSGYSPRGKNTITIVALQGYEPWEKFEADYWSGRKRAYTAEKERMAKKLIERAERAVLPGLSKAIEVREIATPLTNVRYTHNYRGAIYGWEQTLNNSGMRRLPHRTPVKNLYLAGAWTQPGGGYVPAIMSGLQCFREAMKSWT